MLSKLNFETQKEKVIETVDGLQGSLKLINGTYDIIKPLSKLKKELKRKSIKLNRIENSLKKAMSVYELEINWRNIIIQKKIF